jgi:hypothetical protein
MRGRRGRSRAEIAADRERMARLSLEGWTQTEIALEMGLSQPQVCYDLKAVRRKWIKDAVRDMDVIKRRELARIDKLERTYWRAWRESRRDLESRTTSSATGTRGQRSGARLTGRTRDGDPRYLRGIARCIARRCRILGLHAPRRLEHRGLVGGPAVSIIEVVQPGPDYPRRHGEPR